MGNGKWQCGDAETGDKITWESPFALPRSPVPPFKKESTLRYGHDPLGMAESRNAQEWFQTDGEPLPSKKLSALRNHQATGLVYVPSILKDASTV